jgi:hypothetical protein
MTTTTKRVLVGIVLLVGIGLGIYSRPTKADYSGNVHIYRESTILHGQNPAMTGVRGEDVVGFSCAYNANDKQTECFVLSK